MKETLYTAAKEKWSSGIKDTVKLIKTLIITIRLKITLRMVIISIPGYPQLK